MAKVNGLEELWKDQSFVCGWTPRAVARIPQITSLHPGKSRCLLTSGNEGIASGQRRELASMGRGRINLVEWI